MKWRKKAKGVGPARLKGPIIDAEVHRIVEKYRDPVKQGLYTIHGVDMGLLIILFQPERNKFIGMGAHR